MDRVVQNLCRAFVHRRISTRAMRCVPAVVTADPLITSMPAARTALTSSPFRSRRRSTTTTCAPAP